VASSIAPRVLLPPLSATEKKKFLAHKFLCISVILYYHKCPLELAKGDPETGPKSPGDQFSAQPATPEKISKSAGALYRQQDANPNVNRQILSLGHSQKFLSLKSETHVLIFLGTQCVLVVEWSLVHHHTHARAMNSRAHSKKIQSWNFCGSDKKNCFH
jgi:hypothetical protein